MRLGDVGLLGMSGIAYGATLAFAGDVVGGLRRYREAALLGEQTDDLNLTAALRLPRSFGLSYVGPLDEALAATQTDNLDRLANRVFDISTIVLSKYRRIRKAIQSLGMSALLFAISIELEAMLG